MTSPKLPSAGGKYDRQLIVVLLGTTGDAEEMREQAGALNGKKRGDALPSDVVDVQCESSVDGKPGGAAAEGLRRAIAGQSGVPQPVTGRSRVYLVGEGNATDRTVAGLSGNSVAALLADAGLRDAKVISIVADGAARDPDRADGSQTEPGAKSFAAALHRSLLEAHGVRTSVQARVGSVRVVTKAGADASATIDVGRKITAPHPDEPAGEHHASERKVRLSWDGDEQRSEWAY
ncbi:MAG: C80 family cysteine peptidase [Gemmatimonadaceae bacterium]